MKLVFTILLLCFVLQQAWSLEHSAKDFQVPATRIVNGLPAKIEQFPWVVALYFHDPSIQGYEFFCGGALISKSWVLTAAHCMHNMDSVRIQLGSATLREADPHRISLQSTTIIPHEEYNRTYLTNDIGVVKIDPPLDLDPSKEEPILYIALNSNPLDDHTNLTISGWGAISDRNTNLSQILEYTTLQSIPLSQCEQSYGTFIQNGAYLCALSSDQTTRATCSGDSGSPLIINWQHNPVHVGVFSFYHSAGCESGKPSVFTRTDKYRDWIRQKTGV